MTGKSTAGLGSPRAPDAAGGCRSCGSADVEIVLDLGSQPVADLLEEHQPDGAPSAPAHPLRVGVCTRCWLVQLADDIEVPAGTHGHGSSFSTTVRSATDAWLDGLGQRQPLDSRLSLTIMGDADGDLRARFRARGARVVPLDLALSTGDPVDLVVAQHSLAHEQDLDSVLEAMASILAPDGAAEIEFHHVLGFADGGQFDIASHAHHSYLSLLSLQAGLERHRLAVEDAALVSTHGGSVRVRARRRAVVRRPSRMAASILRLERGAGLDSLRGYRNIQARAASVRDALVGYLGEADSRGITVAGYGAPARGTTLLNYCGVTSASLRFTVDRDPRKQHLLLPGCRIPVLAPAALEQHRPDRVLILPWPLADEIAAQESVIGAWGGRFVVALPDLRTLP